MLSASDALPTTQLPQTAELHRSFAVPDVEVSKRSDGKRVVTGLIAPYNTPADIMEVRSGRVVSYSEQFAPGAFHRAAAAPYRVQLQLEHDDRLERLVGYGLEFRDSEAGCVGEFALYPTTADRAVELMDSSHRGLSVTFMTLRPSYGSERDGELVTREQVHLRAVAAVSDPAYADAGVLALRAQADAAIAAQREAERQVSEMVETLTFLRDSGGALTEAQQRWLVEHGVKLATS
jgi:HK97 family phage prohead protease